MRHCPCPVLLVKTAQPWKDGVVLAAIDVGNTDLEHRHLHNIIIDHGYDIASLAKARLHVISAHPSPMLSSADPPSNSAKPSKRGIANNAGRSRPSSTSTINTCTSRKGRLTC